MGSISAARTTESSFVDFAESTDTPDLFVLDGFYNPSIGLNAGYNPTLLRKIARPTPRARVSHRWWASMPDRSPRTDEPLSVCKWDRARTAA